MHQLQAPREDGGLLSFPPLSDAGFLLETNRQRLGACKLDLLGRPFQDVRVQAASWALDAAQEYLAEAGDALSSLQGKGLFLVGHQPDLFHPGVWLKNFALNGLARKFGAVPLNLIVDNDTAKNALLRLPAGDRIVQLPYDAWQSEVPFEGRRVLDETQFQRLVEAADPIVRDWGYSPILKEFWQEACRQGRRTPLLGERLAAARRTFERRWGCHNLEVPLSRVCRTEPFAWFACNLLQELGRFHGIYNETVRAYRRRYDMRSRNHPVPDLDRDGDWLEAPLWGWRTDRPRRRRLFARPVAHGLELRADAEAWPTLRLGPKPRDIVDQWRELEEQGYKIRTRALTTTLYARLFLGDLFLHGLGGGKYDELTDQLIRAFYGFEPPGYLVLTGTLLLPFACLPVTEATRWSLEHERRDLWWNPQRHLNILTVQAAELGRHKQQWIDRPCATPLDRRQRFEELRNITGQLRLLVADRDKAVRLGIKQTEQELRINQVRTRRDYAFCLYPENLLRGFCRRFL